MVYLFLTPLQQNSGHYIPFPHPENLKSRVPFFSENWQLYFSVVYLFLTPLQQNSGHYIPFPQPENLKSRVSFFFRKIGNSTFQWFTSSWPLYSKTPATTSHSHSLKTSKVESLFFPKNWQLYFSVVYLFLTPLQQNSGHYIPYITCFFPQPEKPKSRVPFFPKIGNSTFQWFTSSWPLYSKTPATTSHSHSLKTSKVESLFFRKLATLLFSRLPLLNPSTAKLRPLHPIPTAWKPQK